MSVDRKLYDLVVVGSSAGGIEALSLLVSTLPADFPAPLVLAQHLGPDRPSHLADILARQTVLPVRAVDEGEPTLLADGTVYVVPADRDVEIIDHAVVLHARSTGLPKPSIDLLLASAAHAYGERVIAVILTGTGSDGAAGAQAVKAAGGTVIIENPETASYPAMPASLAPASVDMSLDLARIGPLLHDLLTGVHVLSAPDDILQTLLAETRTYSGIDFSQYKQPTILRRLQRRMTATGTATLQAYVAYLHQHLEEYTQLSASFLIKVTGFFRDRPLFDYLRDSVVAEIVSRARKQRNEIRIWSAGCATGEEAYSLAILIAEYLGDELDHFTVQIFATDADADAVAFARRGVYSAAALATIPEAYRSRYFELADDGWAISQQVRGLVIFGEHDLGQRAPFPHIDLVLCRNVLIYFTPELQKRALQLFAFSLHDRGYLVLGTAETTTPLPDYFTPVQQHLKVFRRQGGRMLVPPVRVSTPKLAPPIAREFSLLPTTKLPAWLELPGSERASAPAQGTAGGRQSWAAHAVLGEQILGLPLGVVVVDRNYDVQAINDAAYALLEISRIAGGRDILHLASRVPTRPFRAAIDAAFHAPPSQGHSLTVTLDLTPGEPRTLEVACYPHRQKTPRAMASSSVDAVILLITDVTGVTDTPREQRSAEDQANGETLPRSTMRRGRKRTGEPSAPQRTAMEEHLEQELAQARAIVREVNAANQELREANQELRQENEELRLREEEAQASAEEVKTLNEELQATNEELETLNEELEATLEELRATNDDLQARTKELEELVTQRHEQRQVSEHERARLAAILASMSDALLVIDAAGNAALTNDAYEMVFGSIESHGAVSSLEDAQGHLLPLEATPHYRAREGVPFTMEFGLRADDDTLRWFEARGQPIRSRESRSEGSTLEGVVTIRDISAGSRLRLQEEFVAMINHELRTPLTAIQAVLQLLARRVQPANEDDRLRNLTEIALRQVRLLRSMVDDLSDLARAQHSKLHLQLQPVDLGALLRQVVESLNTMHGYDEGDEGNQHIVLAAIPDASIPVWIAGDTLRLEQIINNLVMNALTHAPDSRHLDVSLQRKEQWAELRVEDYGPGIPAIDLPHLFFPYYQASRGRQPARMGSGLASSSWPSLSKRMVAPSPYAQPKGQGQRLSCTFRYLGST